MMKIIFYRFHLSADLNDESQTIDIAIQKIESITWQAYIEVPDKIYAINKWEVTLESGRIYSVYAMSKIDISDDIEALDASS